MNQNGHEEKSEEDIKKKEFVSCENINQKIDEKERKHLEWIVAYRNKIPDIIKEIDLKLERKKDEEFKELVSFFQKEAFQKNYSNSNEMSCMMVVAAIYDQEKKDNVDITILHKYDTFLQLFEYIRELKFLLWRTEFFREDENLNTLLSFLQKSNTSVQTILYMLHQTAITPYTTALNIANLYLELQNTSAAFRLLKYANELNPGDEVVLCFMAQICLSVQEVDVARECIEQILHPRAMAEKIAALCGIQDIHKKSVKMPLIEKRNGVQENKIAVITCVNDETKYAECMYYIHRLHIPSGYELEVIPVYGATSMAAGYNKAMHASDAKYKIYIHQDAYILDQDYLYYTLHTFEENKRIGLLGICGVKDVQKSGVYYSVMDEGKLYSNEEVLLTGNGKYKYPENRTVFAIDGFCMMTQYDLAWREDIFDGWDFYDISQSVEFHKAGYEVVVPYQDDIWIMHDCDYPKLKNYEKYKDIFLAYNMQNNATCEDKEQDLLVFDDKKAKEVQTYIKTFDGLFLKDKKKAFESIAQVVAKDIQESEFFYVQSSGRIWEEENKYGIDVFLMNCTCFKDIVHTYKRYEYAIRRVEFPWEESNSLKEFEEMIKQRPERMYAMVHILLEKGIHKKAVLKQMVQIYGTLGRSEAAMHIGNVLEGIGDE